MKFMYFKRNEFACRCCGENPITDEFVRKLDIARDIAGIPFNINSGFRCKKHNEAVGGVENSSHLKGIAADILVKDENSRFKILEGLIRAGFKRIGIGSPSLGYKDYLLLKDQTLLNNINVIQDLKVFVEYGTLESEKTKSGAETLYGLLNANENIRVTKFILDGSHFSAWPETCVKALTFLYAKKKESN